MKTYLILYVHMIRGPILVQEILVFLRILLLKFILSLELFTILTLRVFQHLICINIIFCSSYWSMNYVTQIQTFRESIWNLFYFQLWLAQTWVSSWNKCTDWIWCHWLIQMATDRLCLWITKMNLEKVTQLYTCIRPHISNIMSLSPAAWKIGWLII